MRSVNDLTPEVKTIALNLMEGLSCPRSLTVAILIRYGEWVQLAKLTADPHQYSDAESYWQATMASDFLRKFESLPTGIDTQAVAMETWWQAERQCFKTNNRLHSYLFMALAENDERICDFIQHVRKEVVRLIGMKPPKHLYLSFGQGATMSDKSQMTTVADKMSSVPTMTPRAWPFLVDWVSTKWATAQAALRHEIKEVRGNGYFTVPKDATKDRSCGKEPAINIAYQLAVGKVMKRRMAFSGINLWTGQSTHARVARAGSLSGEVATIDLSSASDTVATALVKLLLPPNWYDLLDSLRSPCTIMPDGKVVKLEKFSSMGNGFTFELESCIFAAIARTVCKDDDYEWSQVSVYGDDIIAPTTRFNELIAALAFFGFTPNKRKTYGTGCFRESCGGDFYQGVAVRPLNLEKELNEPQDYISLANGLRRVALTGPNSADRWHRVIRAWFSCLDNIPSNIRSCRGPQDLGDTVIHDDFQRWSTKTTDSIRYIRSYQPVNGIEVRWEGFAYDVQFAVALYLAGKGREEPTRLPNGNLSPRDSTTGYRVGWTPFS